MSIPSVSIPSSMKMSRSPIFVTGKNDTLSTDDIKSMKVEVYLYTGLRTASPLNENYTLSKSYAVDKRINFEISNLTRDIYAHNPYVSDIVEIDYAPVGEVIWVNLIGTWTYLNAGVAGSGTWNSGTANACLMAEGWSPRPNYENSPDDVLIRSVPRVRYVHPDQYEVLAVNNWGAVTPSEAVIEWSNGDSGNYEWSAGLQPPPYSLYAERAVTYWGVGPVNLNGNPYLDDVLKPHNHDCGESYTIIFYDEFLVEMGRTTYVLTAEPKFTPIQVAFVNRYGVMDFMTFFKKSTQVLNFSAESYKASVYNDGFTSLDTMTRQMTDFNVNATREMTLNSGWVTEDYNGVLEDILMSEEVYVRFDEKWMAINIRRQPLEVKTSVNDKTINFTLSFTFSVNERPLLR